MSLADELRWAHSYDAYELVAADTDTLAQVINVPRTEYLATGHVPDWAGVHLLRAWLFFLQRIDHWNDGLTAGDQEWRAVLAALETRGEKVPEEEKGSERDEGGVARCESVPGADQGGALPNAVDTLARFLADMPLTDRVQELEHRLEGMSTGELGRGLNGAVFAADILNAALTVRRELGRHDDIIHAAVILAMLPHVVVEPGETITVRPSLAAGNNPKVQRFDLETTHRIAEFKVSLWKKADSGRKRTTFADLAKLSMEDDSRKKQLFVVGEAPRRFLTNTKSTTGWGLTKSSGAFREKFQDRYALDMPIRDFTAGPAADVEIVDLAKHLPQLLRDGDSP